MDKPRQPFADGLPNLSEGHFIVPASADLQVATPFAHAPRFLILYGSLRERSFSRFLAYEAARLAPTSKVVLTNRSNPPDFINIKVEELVGDRPFENLDDYITQDELRALSDTYKTVAGFALTK